MKTLLPTVCGFCFGFVPALQAEQVYDWSGLYIGASLGFGSGPKDPVFYDVPGEILGARPPYPHHPQGGFLGAEAGLNLQQGRWVYGLEGDFQFSDIAQEHQALGTTGSAADTTTLDTKLDWFGTVRGRLGYTFQRALVYGTGGVAFGRAFITNSYFFPCLPCGGIGPLTGRGVNEETRLGYTVGGGVEYAIDRVWSVKVEYSYLDLGRIDVSAVRRTNTGAVAGGPYQTEVDVDFHTLRIGLNYRLGANQVALDPE